MNIRNTAAISASLALVAAGAVASVEGEVVQVSGDVSVSPELAKSIDNALSGTSVQSRVEATVDAIYSGFGGDSSLADMASIQTDSGVRLAATEWLPTADGKPACHTCYGDCHQDCYADCHANCHYDCHTDCYANCHYDCYTPACHTDCYYDCHYDCYTPACHTDCYYDCHMDCYCYSAAAVGSMY